MPVFVINCDPNFDLPGIARRDGLDLFQNQRLQLIEALQSPSQLQIERLWGDWPPCLEANRNNLRAEIDRIVAAAALQPDEYHVVVFVLDKFAPNDPSQRINRELLQEIARRAYAKDRKGLGTETGESHGNFWMIAYLRVQNEPEEAALGTKAENQEGLVNNVFVSAFNGKEADRPASDFLTLRVLAEILLHHQESRRFLQVGIQNNAYDVTCITGPRTLPPGGASRVLRRALDQTLFRLQQRNAPAAGSSAISAPAKKVNDLVVELVAQAKKDIGLLSTFDTTTPDQRFAEILEAGAPRQPRSAGRDPTASAIDILLAPFIRGIRWRPRDGFAEVRSDLEAQLSSEQSAYRARLNIWARHRPKKMESFAALNVDILKSIDALSKAAVGSRGNDIKIIENLITDVERERAGLKVVALQCRATMGSVEDEAGAAKQQNSAVDAARRTFEFELDQVPQRRSVAFFLAASVAAASLPYATLLWNWPANWASYLMLALALPLVVLAVTIFALNRRRKKLSQAASDLREALHAWRKGSTRGFDDALRYQTITLGAGWLGSIAAQLEDIKRSIELRSEALDDCREMLAVDLDTNPRSPEEEAQIEKLISKNVGRLQDIEWDQWIIRFLSEERSTGAKANARVHLANDGEWRDIAIPGFNDTVTVQVRTPDRLSQASATVPPQAPIDATAARAASSESGRWPTSN